MADATFEVETRITGEMAQGLAAVEREAKRASGEISKSLDQVTASANRFTATSNSMAANTSSNVSKMRAGVAAGFGAIQSSTIAMERGFLNAADAGRVLSTGLLAIGGGAVTAGIVLLSTALGTMLARMNALKQAAQDTSYFGDNETIQKTIALVKEYQQISERIATKRPSSDAMDFLDRDQIRLQNINKEMQALGHISASAFIEANGGAEKAIATLEMLEGNAKRARDAIAGIQVVEAERAKQEAAARLAQAQAGGDPVAALTAKHKSELDAMDLQAASRKERLEKLGADLSTLQAELARKSKVEDQRQVRERIEATQQEYDALSGIISAGESARRTTIQAQAIERQNLESKLAEERLKKIEEEARKEAELIARLSEELAVIEAGEDPLAQHDARLAARLAAVQGNEEAQTLVLQQHVTRRNQIIAQQEKNRLENTEKINELMVQSFLSSARSISGSIAELTGNSKAAFIINKAVAYAESVINTAQGVTKALAMGPLGIPLAKTIGVLGGIQSSLILATAIKGFAKGTMNAPGGLALVGEQGPELINIPTGSRVFSAPETENIIERAFTPSRGVSREVSRYVSIQAPMTFVFEGSVDDRTIERVNEVVGERLNALGRDLREIEYEGTPK